MMVGLVLRGCRRSYWAKRGKEKKSSMQEQLEYINEGRGGYVVYKDDISEIKFFFEYGGGNCVAIIYVPSSKEWEKETNKSINHRQRILTFIAEQSRIDQAPGCVYELSEECIGIIRPSSTTITIGTK